MMRGGNNLKILEHQFYVAICKNTGRFFEMEA
jgi:hypothetical protein